MKAQESAEKNPKSVQASKVLGHFAKAEVRYWRSLLTCFRGGALPKLRTLCRRVAANRDQTQET